jgi:ABC-type multidrug transport system fused ATPase/permease subunit
VTAGPGVRALLPYLRAYRGTLAVVVLLSMTEAAATLAQPLLTRSVLDRVGHSRPVVGQVTLLVGLLVVVAVVGGVRDYALSRVAEGLVLTARRRLVAHLLRLPIAEYDRRRTGDLLSRVGADTTLLRAVITSGLFESATSMLLVVGATVAMAVLDPLLFLATAAGIAVGLVVILVLARHVRGASRLAQQQVGELTAAMERAIVAVRTIRASNAEERESGVIDRRARDAHDAGLAIGRLQSLVSPVMTVTVQAAFLVVLGVGGARVASGAMSVGELVAFVFLLFLLWFPLARALGAYTRLQAGLGALQRIEEIQEVPLDSDAVPGRRAGGARTSGHPPALEFDRVSFAYRGGEPVLREVSFAVPYGSRTAIVGPSGAGKSTVLALVERFYDVTGGAIRVGGVDVRDMPRRLLRRQVGYVEQEAPALAGSLRDNLALAAPHATDEEILAVLRLVNLAGVVDRSPDGLDAQVGEAGVLLSGGERQRLAIARAFLTAAPITLLDEATSNLDALNEAALRDAITVTSVDRTLLVVAHRLATVVDSDEIIVLEDGRVSAAGRHGELTTTSPLYRRLAENQLLVS